MDPMIRDGDQLTDWFFAVAQTPRREEQWQKGIYVTARVRRDVLTGDRQGGLILKGNLRTILFDRFGGGVYRAYLGPLRVEGGGE